MGLRCRPVISVIIGMIFFNNSFKVMMYTRGVFCQTTERQDFELLSNG